MPGANCATRRNTAPRRISRHRVARARAPAAATARRAGRRSPTSRAAERSSRRAMAPLAIRSPARSSAPRHAASAPRGPAASARARAIESTPQLAPIRRRRGGGGRWRGRPHVGDQIAQRHVGLVTDGGDDGHRDGGDGARDALAVERPQIFLRATAAPDDRDIEPRQPRQERQRGAHLALGAVALHARRDEHQRRHAASDVRARRRCRETPRRRDW